MHHRHERLSLTPCHAPAARSSTHATNLTLVSPQGGVLFAALLLMYNVLPLDHQAIHCKYRRNFFRSANSCGLSPFDTNLKSEKTIAYRSPCQASQEY